MTGKSSRRDPSKLRSRKWFANPDNPNMTALYLERGCIAVGALAWCLDPAAPAADAVTQGQVAQVELRHRMTLVFEGGFEPGQVGVEGRRLGVAIKEGDLHFCGTFPDLICSITLSAHSRVARIERMPLSRVSIQKKYSRGEPISC